MSAEPPNPIEVVIEPSRGLRVVRWGELYSYRDLLWLLVWRDLSARYKQTILGPLWFIVQPLLTTLMFVLLSRVARIATSGVPATLFYLCGLLTWSYFSACFNSTSLTLANNAALFGKVYFPRLILPLSGVVSNLAAFAIQLALFGAAYGLFKATAQAPTFGATSGAWLLPLVLLQVAALSLGVGLWLAALTTRFRDFGLLAGFGLQLWMYATPVLYPLSAVPARWRTLVALNPLSMPVEWTRHMLLGAGLTDLRLGLVSAAATAVALITGLVVFARAEKTFVDVL